MLVPGGPGEVAARAGGAVLDWLREADRTSTWTTSVCTGSLILAAAGLLEGRRATTHWLAFDELRRLGAEPVDERVVFDGKLVTGAGVSAGIDMALTLAARIAGDVGRPGDPARHRVRPAAAVRRRLAAEGAGRDRRAAAQPQSLPGAGRGGTGDASLNAHPRRSRGSRRVSAQAAR